MKPNKSNGVMSNSNISSKVFIADEQSTSNNLTFSQIKIRYEVLARFEIE